MAKTWSAKWNPPKHWRLRATAPDRTTVTLGRYETAEQAQADRASFVAQGLYRDITVEPIEPKPDPPAAESAPR